MHPILYVNYPEDAVLATHPHHIRKSALIRSNVEKYAYNDPYVTPYPTSTIEGQPWSSYVRASVPEVPLPSYSQQHQQHYLQHPPIIPTQIKDPSRPRSSPSTFGPSADSIAWPVTTTGLGIQYSSTAGQPTPVTSTFPPSVFQTFPTGDHYGSSSPPELRQPQPRRPYPPIAPNPAGLVKRRQDDDEQMERSSSKRRKRTASVASADLNEDDRFLVQLKEDENLPWKDIATRFQTDKGKNFQVAALQMRYKRLREKFRVWEDKDVNALRLAHEYWEKYKWEIITTKVCSTWELLFNRVFACLTVVSRCLILESTKDGHQDIALANGRN
ncbi:hypothetical protein M433DRAFT_150289 [Acidomyces richmondensis BFW]|nr:MAG: hypothetical protein FE78DRAFT_94267 [Acidomyces sp. 'richmondensis']KYG49217.1 hypothetical protein M433DRAFT_150289 [Acidomyces richmondensis BFW]